MTKIGVIGYGYWGPNIVRNFSRIHGVGISWICDVNPNAIKSVTHMYPAIRTTAEPNDILNDPDVTAVVIVTPTSAHFPIAHAALSKHKHVLLEKPMTQTVGEARSLVLSAKKHKRILMVDHTFIYTPAIRKIKQIIDAGHLGSVYYIDCVRTNLGLLQKDSNVIYDLSTHDFSIIDYLFGVLPLTVSASGLAHSESTQEAAAYVTARYPKSLYVHSHVSWLSPVKIRRITFVGTKKMLVYDDMEPTEKVKIYDKSISVTADPKAQQQLRVGYRIGSTVAPHVEVEEGLSGMAEAFIKAIKSGKSPPSDGAQGLRVVQSLAAATASLRAGGKRVSIHSGTKQQ